MSLVTPEKIRSLQRKLYVKAKAEPAFRFYVLYDKICRVDILLHAYRLARANAGAPGVDGITFAQIEERGLEAWLAGLREELVAKTYRPDPVRRVMIPKASGDGERPLGISSGATPMSLMLIYRAILTRFHTRTSLSRWPGVWSTEMSCVSSRCGSGRPLRSAMQTELGGCRVVKATSSARRKVLSSAHCSPTST
jgi:hypothetical protein